MGEEFTENLFQSVDTIVKARLANLPYDKTIECEIINDNESFNNKYLVKYQASNFIVYSNNSTYKVGDIVYVQVPQADFTQDKFIINKKMSQEENVIGKRLPFLSFVKNKNLSTPTLQNREFFLETTGDKEEVSLNAYTYSSFYGESYAAGYTRLGIKIGIKANINQDLISGSYGIKIIVKGFDQQTTYLSLEESNSILIEKEFILSMEDMISSNPYNTLGYCNQEKVFNIEDFVIKSIDIKLYHKGDFITIDKQALNKMRIYFNNLSVFLGYDISDFSKSLKRNFLYTTAGYKYDNEHYIKPIYVRFVEAINNKTDLQILTQELQQDNIYNIYWEEYNPLIKTTGLKSNIISFQSLVSEEQNNIFKNIIFNEGQSRLRYSFITIIEDVFNNKYVSNRLDFVRDTYFNEKELIDLLTGFFRIDDFGSVYLNGGVNTSEKDGLNITNIILNDFYIAKNSKIYLKDNLTIVNNNNEILLEINNDNIKINLPIVYSSQEG